MVSVDFPGDTAAYRLRSCGMKCCIVKIKLVPVWIPGGLHNVLRSEGRHGHQRNKKNVQQFDD